MAAATYYETTGWRGVIQGDAPSPVPERFPARAGMVFPLYHVFADLAEWRDGTVVRSQSSDPLAVETLVLDDDGTRHYLIANLTPTPRVVALDGLAGQEITLRRLNERQPPRWRQRIPEASARAWRRWQRRSRCC